MPGCWGGERAEILAFVYGVKKAGNALSDPGNEFGDTNILYQDQTFAAAATRFKKSEEEIGEIVGEAKSILVGKRRRRSRPHLDDKIITAWNGLMITALARAAQVLDNKKYLLAANRNADFIMENILVDDQLRRRFRHGDARYAGNLEDYAFLIQGMLDLYGADHKPERLRQAIRLTEIQTKYFSDERGGFFDGIQSDELPVRMKGAYDGAEPAGNSVAALNLLRLARITGEDEWLEKGRLTIKSFGSVLAEYPATMVLMLSALDLYLDKPRQIIVAGEPGAADTRKMFKIIADNYLPNTIVLLADGGVNQKFLAKYQPIIKGMVKLDNKATAYLCEDFVCQLPTNEPRKLTELLNKKELPLGK